MLSLKIRQLSIRLRRGDHRRDSIGEDVLRACHAAHRGSSVFKDRDANRKVEKAMSYYV
jgi:hypothetical protein